MYARWKKKTNVNKVNWYVIFFWFIVCNFNSFPYTTIFKLAAINHPSIYLSIHPSIHFLHTGSSTFSNSLRFQYLFFNNKWLADVNTKDRILNTVIVHLLLYHRQDRKHHDKLRFQREKKTQQENPTTTTTKLMPRTTIVQTAANQSPLDAHTYLASCQSNNQENVSSFAYLESIYLVCICNW